MKNSKWAKLVRKEDILKLKEDDSFDFYTTNLARHFNIPNRRMGELLRFYNIHIKKLTRSQKLTTEEFVKEAKTVHGDKYDYSKTIYINNVTPLIIICREHGEFRQSPARHKSGSICSECARIKMNDKNRVNIADFIREAQIKHDYKYKYHLVHEYKSQSEFIDIICPVHGVFTQRAYAHRSGSGCERCSYDERGLKIRVTIDEWVKDCTKIHGGKFDYSKVTFDKVDEIVTIICPYHGEFKQRAREHRVNGCSTCGKLTGAYAYSKDENYVEKAKEIESYLYVFEFEDFYKIGISNNPRSRKINVKSRLKLDYTPKTLIKRKDSLFNTVNLEELLHTKYKEYRFTHEKIFEGRTECFSKDLPIEEIISFLKNN